MNNIDTLVFDYGGVIVNLDNKQVADALCGLGVSRFKQILYARRIKRLMRDFIDGLIPTSQTLIEMQKLCSKGTTIDDIKQVLYKLCADLPKERLDALVQLRSKYKVYMLSNISDVLWDMSAEQIRSLGYAPEDCFDRFFLSYEMGAAKPDSEIYRKMIASSGLIPERTLYFEDRPDNCAAGMSLGFKTVNVQTNFIEQTPEWQALLATL